MWIERGINIMFNNASMNKNSISYETSNLLQLYQAVTDCQILVPKFQREFEWRTNDIIKLYDSIVNQYLIGNITLWETKEQLMLSDSQLNGYTNSYYTLPELHKKYIIDGQQRVTSIYGLIKGDSIQGKHELIDFKEFYISLSGDLKIFHTSKKQSYTNVEKSNSIRLHTIINYDYTKVDLDNLFEDLFSGKSSNEIKEFKQRFLHINNILKTFTVGITTQQSGNINDAIKIFSRVNSSNTRLSDLDLFSAYIYYKKNDEEKDVRDIFDELKETLANKKYTLSNNYLESILNSYYVYILYKENNFYDLSKVVSKFNSKIYLNIDKELFWDNLDYLIDTVENIPEFLSENFNINSYNDIPYKKWFLYVVNLFLLLFPNYNSNNLNVLKKYIIYMIYTSRLQYATSTEMARYIGGMVKYHYDYTQFNESNYVPDFLSNYIFENRYSDIKNIKEFEIIRNGEILKSSILFLLLQFNPTNLINGKLLLNNGTEYTSNSLGLHKHHIFPKYWYKNNYNTRYIMIEGVEVSINNSLNISFIDSDTNIRIINDNPPSKYFPILKKSSLYYDNFINTQLLSGDTLDMLLGDNYEQFILNRAKLLKSKILELFEM